MFHIFQKAPPGHLERTHEFKGNDSTVAASISQKESWMCSFPQRRKRPSLIMDSDGNTTRK